MKDKTESGKKTPAMRFLCLPTARPLDTDVYLCSCGSKCKSFCQTQCLGNHCSTEVCNTKCTVKCDTQVTCTGDCTSLGT